MLAHGPRQAGSQVTLNSRRKGEKHDQGRDEHRSDSGDHVCGRFIGLWGRVRAHWARAAVRCLQASFLLSVLVVKLGLAVGFVLLFSLARRIWARRWPLYALVWWDTFAITEVGQAIGPNYSWLEAGAGIIAEAIYYPLAAMVTARLLATAERDAISA